MTEGNGDPIARMTLELSRLPGIGQKSAQRLAYHIASLPLDQVKELAAALWQGRKALRFCARCGNYSQEEYCPVCADERRDRSTVCVVESPKDITAFERTREYKGVYHVLHGSISPLNGVGPDDLTIKQLLSRIGSAEAREVIMATNPTVEGDATALYISKLLKPMGVKVTRLAYGIPVGGDLEYADEYTLAKALEGRNEI